ncbi:CpsD/CapB family tyrosine-protein kinase [Ruixingdingia sedimenti]|uniref:CpsD/CapB family tyrosine-protein kinase n=1 Tax=Ruixingdingia sedimenti TaxID=3073604 RepID=A0ABU1F7J0_9RHOB|nr:CpsD/CapB family tyrosine-protein kinase [Xinfangfangia sp. LG-4]MDR5652842.1 CpsD/CapB family tyrosine-protein kinase [Xinfangfangia sp. LG-4]
MDQIDMVKDSDSPQGGRSGISVFRYHRGTQDLPAVIRHGRPRDPFAGALMPRTDPARRWEQLTAIQPDPQHLERHRLLPTGHEGPAATRFDMLRTRILQTMEERQWTRLAVTSPTRGCGKSMVAANLALALARLPQVHTVLVDLELRHPGLADLLGVADPGALRDYLTDDQPLESHFLRIGANLALGLNGTPVPDAAALLQASDTREALEAMQEALEPDIVIYDLPPALAGDDVIGFLPAVDCVLLVADGTRTRAEDITACTRLLEGRTPVLGVVLNRAEEPGQARYRYDAR